MPKTTIAIDIETFSSVDLKKAGVYKYVESDDFQVILFSYKKNNADVIVEDLTKKELSKEIINLLYDPSVIKTAYNANFEYRCLNKYLEQLGYTEKMPIESWEDTMLLSSYAGFGGSLEKTAEAMGLEVRKDKSGTYLINKFSKPRKPSKTNKNTRFLPEDDPVGWEKFKEYNKQDVRVESEIRYQLNRYIEIPKKERDGWLLDLKIAENGIGIDKQLVESAIELDKSEKERLLNRMFELTGLQNPNSNSQITQWLSKRLNREINSVKKSVIPDLIKECESIGDLEAKEVLQLRTELAKTSLAKYYAIQERLCEDNRIHGVLQFYGSRTGRWAGRGVQVQNLPRNNLPSIPSAREMLKTGEIEALRVIYGQNVSDTASELIRTAFIPGKGNVFAVADYSAIEARVIAWLSGENWRLDVFKNKGGKIYEASASQMFNVDFDKICDKNAPEHALRAQGKVAELALGYQGSVGAIARMDFNNAIPEEDRQRIVDQWRQASPNIVNLWKQCEFCAISAIKTPYSVFSTHGIDFKFEDYVYPVLTVKLPSGRYLYYPYPKLGRGQFGNTAVSFIGINQVTRKVERIDTYGGKLVENIVQAIARDCLAESLLRLDNLGYEIRFHVHDEIIVEVSESKAQEELDRIIKIMCEPPAWAYDLPLNAAGFVSPFYKKD